MIYVDRKSLKIPREERVICRYGDNDIERRAFEIGENTLDCSYVLYIAFSDGSVNSILLENGEENTAVWVVKAEHIFTAGIAYIQIKAISKSGEIWHSPEATVEFLYSIDEEGKNGEYSPSLLEQLDERINDVLDLAETIVDSILKNEKDYITRPEAVELVNDSIDNLLLPLNRRLDGENAEL